MGDFSRNTFELTNVMHQLLTGQVVANPRHYIGVKLQQGVPVLDADWNELEDIRHMELRAILHFFIGNGVPANNQGLAVSESSAPNDFAIGPGVILFDGLLAINLGTTTYSTQPDGGAPAPLSTPPGGTDRTDVAYLDVWHEQVRGVGAGSDERLINAQIGIETTIRVARRWCVRVREGADDLLGLAVPPGHHFLPLAQFQRRGGVAAIRESMIIDLRKQGITLAENLKVPLQLKRGLEVLDVQRFEQMTRGLRSTLFLRLKNDQLPYQTAAPNASKKETLILMALQELMHLAQIGQTQAAGRSMDNGDALRFMHELYTSQNVWIDILEELGNDAAVAQEFIDGYRDRLEGSAGALIKGLKPALDRNDLLTAVIAQEELNLWLTAAIDNLPEGGVDAVYQSVIPFENLTAGSSYDFTYDIRANFTSPQATEDFQIQVTLPGVFGSATVDQPLLTLTPPADEATVTVTVVPSGGSLTATMDVAAISVRNATLRSPQPAITLTLNALPPVGAFFYYAGPRLNVDGRLEILQLHLTRPQGRNIQFRLNNNSGTENRTYQVTGQIIPNVANSTGWSPLAPTVLPPITVVPGSQTDVLIRVDGPKTPGNEPPQGTTGNIVASAVLTLIDGAPPGDPQMPVTLTIPFVVV